LVSPPPATSSVDLPANGPELGMNDRSAYPRCASARRSSRREVIPSLVNTLPRCHSTVRALRNSWAPISVLVCPSCASRAMDASCAVSSVRASGVCLRTASPALPGPDRVDELVEQPAFGAPVDQRWCTSPRARLCGHLRVAMPRP
jgi:hypothetical protein